MTDPAAFMSPLGTAGLLALGVGPAGVVWFLLILAMALAFVRLLRGPDLSDRAVVLDLLASLAQGVLALYAIATGEAALLDVAIAIALVSFLGTVSFARYIEKRARTAAQERSEGRG